MILNTFSFFEGKSSILVRKNYGQYLHSKVFLLQDCRIHKIDFHSLMKKKLGGKYDQPKLAADDMAELDIMAKADDMAKENNMAKEKDNNIEDDKEGAPETDTDEDGQVTPPRSPHLDDAMLTSPPKTPTIKSKKARVMATFKP